MTALIRRIAVSAVVGLCLTATCAFAAPISLGDSGVAIRSSDGRSIDVDSTIDHLVAMRVDTYLYDIPHGTDAWDKLPAFADAAARHHIDVWVYLFPWSLAHRGGRDLSNEPFGTDYVRWCSEVGKLSRDHPNIRGIVMDDFASNMDEPDRFSPQYVQRMLDAGHAANPGFGFQPILYFDGPWERTLANYATFFKDGAIVCYPRSTREVDHAMRYLNDRPRGATLSVELPRRRKLRAGEETVAVGRLDTSAAAQASDLAFFVDDHGDSRGRRGEHQVVVRVNGQDVWHRLLDGSAYDRNVNIPLRGLNQHSTIEVAVVCIEPAEDEVVRSEIQDLRLLDPQGHMLTHQPRWADEVDDGIAFQISQPTGRDVAGRWQIPMTIMVAGAPFEHQKIFDEPGDAAHIGMRVQQAIEWAQADKARGVMTWWTPKDGDANDRAVRDAVATAFAQARSAR